jgi:hypothetical protein
MPYLTGTLTREWAIIDVLVAVNTPRRGLLAKHQFPVPAPVHVRALLDTGASMSGFSPRVFRELDLTPVAQLAVITPSTPTHAPHECNLFDVSLSLVADGTAHQFPDTRMLETDCWFPGEKLEALIGMDILCRCFFQLMGPERKFVLAF